MHDRQDMINDDDDPSQDRPLNGTPSGGGGADQTPASIQSIATQAAAAMAAAMVAQQLLASAAATCGLDLASLSQFAIMAASQTNGQTGAGPANVPQTPEQLMAAAVAAATFLSHTNQANQLQAAAALNPLLNANNNNNNSNNLNSSSGHSSTTGSPQLNQLASHLNSLAQNHDQSPILPEDLTTLAESVQQQQQHPQHNSTALKLEHHLNSTTNSNNLNHLTNHLNSLAAANQANNAANVAANHLNFGHGLNLNLSLNHHPSLVAATAAIGQHHSASNGNAGSNGTNTTIGPVRARHQNHHPNQHQNHAYHRHSSSSGGSSAASDSQHHDHHHHHHHHHPTRHLLGHHHHSSIQTQQQLLATKGYNPLAVVVGSGQQTEILTPTHLRKAKLMFFYVRYPNSSTLKECFRDVRFNKNNTAQLVKWFSNFREFYYIQMEKFAREAVNDDENVRCKEDIVVEDDSHELINVLNNHYNKNRHIPVPLVFLEVVQETLRHFYDAIKDGRSSEQSWKKAIYKIIARLDQEVPEEFKTDRFNAELE